MEWIEQAWELASTLAREYWAEATFSLACLLVGSWWGRRRISRHWRKKEFLGRLNVSLNMLEDGTLRIRTLLDEDLTSVFVSPVAADMVKSSARRTTEANPLLPLGKDDAWYCLNDVLNEVSEQFAKGFLQRDLGQPVTSAVYLLCLTCEKAGAMRTRKIRAMLIRKEQLLSLPEEMPALESPNHSTRWETLKSLAGKFATEPHAFLEVELCV